MNRLSGKNALITGAARGLGAQIARRFAEEGAFVIVNDLNLAAAQAVAEELDGAALACDVSDASSVAAMFSQLRDVTDQLDILVNNAGINGADGINLEDCDDDLSKKLFEVNTFGVYYGLKYGPQYMNDGGSIINTASLAASYVFPGSGPYSASKAAVANLTTMSASELAKRRIRVNAVAPSFIRTPLAMDDIELFEKIGERATNALRIAEPEEVAAVFHFLASDDAGYINGQVINVDGGMSIGLTEAMVELIAR